jgi:hypothetical protein
MYSGDKDFNTSLGHCNIPPAESWGKTLLVYNRIPKAASSSMLSMLGKQHARAALTRVHSTAFNDHQCWTLEQVIRIIFK